MNFPPRRGSLYASNSAISVEGVMGYPAKNSRPAYRAASTQVSFPCTNRSRLLRASTPQTSSIARSGQRSSHSPQLVQFSGWARIGFSPSSRVKALAGQNAIQIPQSLHQSRLITGFRFSSALNTRPSTNWYHQHIQRYLKYLIIRDGKLVFRGSRTVRA